MKQLFKFSTILLLILSATVVVSCKDKQGHDNNGADHDHAKEIAYICPMDCEDGKTYEEMGTCPVCKMDLKQVAHASGCKCTKDGDCKCEDGKCNCKACAKHGDAKKCSMHKDGKCKHPEGECNCKDCPEHAGKATCTMHADGNCNHEEGECDCKDCPVHNKE
ncbi:MAG: heavy metal-binding domain-containing protein [Gilvibacter sp.]